MSGAEGPRLGLTVMPEFVQVEGIDRVIENIGTLGATTIVTVPSVLEPAEGPGSVREPPADAGAGTVRVLERPLWGRTALGVRAAPSFRPDEAHYADTAFRPPLADALTDREGRYVPDFLKALKREGIQTQLQLMAAFPPGIRVQGRLDAASDEPITADGRRVQGRVDGNLSLASADLRRYMQALISDVIAQHPNCDVIRFDWPEYPPYAPDSLLFDFSAAALASSQRLGIDAERLRAEVMAGLRAIDPVALAARLAGYGPGTALAELRRTGWIDDLLAWRAALVSDYVRFLVRAVADASQGQVGVALQAFPPPMNELSGFDLAANDGLAADVGVKLYTMHWPMILANHATRLMEAGKLGEQAALAAANAVLGVYGEPPARLETVRYPEPDEDHAAPDWLIRQSLKAAASQLKQSRFWALGHSYGPMADVERRLIAAFEGSCGHVHLNRYGYMNDEKFTRLGALWRRLAAHAGNIATPQGADL